MGQPVRRFCFVLFTTLAIIGSVGQIPAAAQERFEVTSIKAVRPTLTDTISALQPLLSPPSDRDHLDRALKHYRKTRKSLDDLAVNDRDRTPIRPEYLIVEGGKLAGTGATSYQK